MSEKSRFKYIIVSLSSLVLVCLFSNYYIVAITSFVLLTISVILSRGYGQDKATAHVYVNDDSDSESYFSSSRTKRTQIPQGADNIWFKHGRDERVREKLTAWRLGSNSEEKLSDYSSKMWGNRSFSKSKQTEKMNMNATLPALRSTLSPMTIRLRVNPSNSTQSPSRSILSAAGPLLSSPFIPQIKRALGLDPVEQPRRASVSRRHSFNVVSSTASPGVLPHVRFGKSQRASINERNTSMLNRSNTVRIAPPTPGRVGSPSIFHMQSDISVTEDRLTPNTSAVVSALKERRKRSINSNEDSTEVPSQQAKRRRQESQQSNASTSSLPSLPDNLPDLASSYTQRIETPGLKRPSRPSQDSSGEWETPNSTKRPRGDLGRNNSILSSLSSSRRFADKQRDRSLSKRKADTDTDGKENQDHPMSKVQKGDTSLSTRSRTASFKGQMNESTSENKSRNTGQPQRFSADQESNQTLHSISEILRTAKQTEETVDAFQGTKEDAEYKRTDSFLRACVNKLKLINPETDLNVVSRRAEAIGVIEQIQDRLSQKAAGTDVQSSPSTNSVTMATSESETIKKTEPYKPPLLKSLSTKRSSIYSGLGTGSSFRKVPYANVIATAEDYERDREAEQNRVKQLLDDVDQSFNEKTAKPSATSLVRADGNQSTLVPSTTSSSSTFNPQTLPASTTAAITSIADSTTATTSSSTLASNSNGLGSVSRPQVKEIVPQQETSPDKTRAQSEGTDQSQTATSISATPHVAAAVVSSSSATSAPTFKPLFGTATTSTSSSATSSVVGGFNFNPLTTATVPSATTAPKPAGGFSFGSGTGSTSSTPSATGSLPSTGFNLGAASSAPITSVTNSLFGQQAGQSAPISQGAPPPYPFGSTLTSTQTSQPSTATGSTNITGSTASIPTPGFNFGSALKAASSTSAPSSATGGFSFMGAQSTTTAKPSTGSGFSMNTSGVSSLTSAPQSLGANSGFSFGTGSTASQSVVGVTQLSSAPSATPASGFTFGTNSTQATSTAGGLPGFNFGGAQKPTGLANSLSSPPSFFSATTTAQVSVQQATTTATPAPSGFAFGTSNTQATSAAAPAPFAFGAKPATSSTTPAASSTFSFGVGSTSSNSVFKPQGSTVITTPSPAAAGFSFGTGSSQAPTQPSSGFSFGAGGAAPAFGASQNTPSAGFTFGANSSQQSAAPAFGGSSTAPSAGLFSGTQSQSTNQVSAFGSSTPQLGSQTPAFGTGSQPQAPAFGATQGSSTPVFGNTANQPAPAFGSSTPAQSTGTFAFGANQPQAAAPFGQNNTPSKPTGAVFAFGQANNQTPVKNPTGSASTGFDFSASLGGAGGSSQFNFSANNSFGTPGASPAFNPGTLTPGTFHPGTVPTKPRAYAKSKRRTAKR